jgi:hypothetical protein
MRGKARKLYLAMGLALVAMFVAAGAVFAAVTFDPATGTGFVGKGDVQLAFNLNNKQLQQNASKVSFTYEEVGEYTLLCKADDKTNPKTGVVTPGAEKEFKNRAQSVQSSVQGDPRQVKGQNQFTGFNLSGITSTVTTGESCPGGFPTELSRTPQEGAGTVIGLIAHLDLNNDGDTDDPGESVVIWTPPAPAPEPAPVEPAPVV